MDRDQTRQPLRPAQSLLPDLGMSPHGHGLHRHRRGHHQLHDKSPGRNRRHPLCLQQRHQIETGLGLDLCHRVRTPQRLHGTGRRTRPLQSRNDLLPDESNRRTKQTHAMGRTRQHPRPRNRRTHSRRRHPLSRTRCPARRHPPTPPPKQNLGKKSRVALSTWLRGTLLAISARIDDNSPTSRYTQLPHDRDLATAQKFYEDSLEAWRKNPIARRIVGIISDYVLGDGITIESKNTRLQRFIEAFWSHPENNIELRLY